MILKDLDEKYTEYIAHTQDNEFEIIVSKQCGCLSCGQVFSARLVQGWEKSEGKNCAVCPFCGAPRVVGDGSGLAVDTETINKIAEGIRNPDSEASNARQDKETYCLNFFQRNIQDNLANEEMYIRFLGELFEESNDPIVCLALARAYGEGMTYIPKDLDKAISYYKNRCLKGDAQATYELGLAYDARNREGDDRLAFEAFSRSAALGSLSASASIANAYIRGRYVEKDEEFGVCALINIFDEMYPRLFTNGSLTELAANSYNIGLCFLHGMGAEENHYRALRYFLIAQFAAEYGERQGEACYFKKDIDDAVNRLGDSEYPRVSDMMVFDTDTFFDSFYEQQDDDSTKTIIDLVENPSSRSVDIHFSSPRPMLLVDVANRFIEAYSEVNFHFEEASLEERADIDTFERVEFDNESVIRLMHKNPNNESVCVAKIVLRAMPEQQ
ncbi:MAG: sel1 repeat family protein [Bacilli bacterium]|nr:sel1 repeat family protein [Bacilli bacterium]